MYIDRNKTGKYRRVLLRESYRDKNGKVQHRTIANLSDRPADEIHAIEVALKHKAELAGIHAAGGFQLRQGDSAGAVLTVYQAAERLGIVAALGPSRDGKLALWQVIARVIDQGSRLSAVRLAKNHLCCDLIGLDDGFTEDDLYSNLRWIDQNQARIEDRLIRHRGETPSVYLYDVTSSYLEGEHNSFGAFGYNRDKKKGKLQIVIGLLCDQDGAPLSIEVFPGNTSDTNTFGSQVQKAATRFGAKEVIFVGDRGMIKSKQVAALTGKDFHFHYITAITTAQTETLLKKNVLQLELFDQDVCEVTQNDGLRYVLRRNPVRADEVARSRMSKIGAVEKLATQQTVYLTEHLRAKPAVAQRKLEAYAKKLLITDLVDFSLDGRTLILRRKDEAISDAAKLDGCYVLKTDVAADVAPAQVIHDRYKDLAKVESAFRTSKTAHLEVRPVYVIKEASTCGHVFVVMLAYLIVQELTKNWISLNLTVSEGLERLDSFCSNQTVIAGRVVCQSFPVPRTDVQELLDLAKVRIPRSLPCRNIPVDTRKKLPENRKKIRQQQVTDKKL